MTDYSAHCDGCGYVLAEVVYKACEAVALYTGKGVQCPTCDQSEWTFHAHEAKRDPQGVPAARQD